MQRFSGVWQLSDLNSCLCPELKEEKTGRAFPSDGPSGPAAPMPSLVPRQNESEQTPRILYGQHRDKGVCFEYRAVRN